MSAPLSQAEAQAVSSHVKVDLSRVAFMETITNSVGQTWVDPLSMGLIERLRSPRNLRPLAYANKPITTVSYELYGTTTLWYLILYINGIMHPDEIVPGTILQVPTRQIVEDVRALNKITASKKGEVVIT